MVKNKRRTIFTGTFKELKSIAEGQGFVEKEEVVELLNKFKGEVLSLPNRDDKLHCRILMPDGGGVDRFEITTKIENLIKLLEKKE